jgi:hypothetical protein
MPDGYGVQEMGPYLDWTAVESRLIEATEYWLASTRPDSRPHVIPRWGVWVDDRFWYDGSPETRHAVNLEVNPSCALHLGSGRDVTIVEGRSLRSEPITGDLGRRLSEEYARKYRSQGYAPPPDAWSGEAAGGMRVLTPEKAIAWTEFPTDVTRFTFI